MPQIGEVWASSGRTVRVVEADATRVIVRDTYGWRRSLTADELERGFTPANGQAEPERPVMARRSLADLQPA